MNCFSCEITMSKCESEMYIGKTRASLEIIFDFDDIWCRSWKLNDLTDNDIPNKLYYDMCSRKFLKDLKEECEGKKEEKICTCNCLFRWYDECSIVCISQEWLVFTEKKERNPSLISIIYTYMGSVKHTTQNILIVTHQKKRLIFSAIHNTLFKRNRVRNK